MKKYRFKAIDASRGQTVSGVIRAGGETDAVKQIQKQGHTLLELSEVSGPPQNLWRRFTGNALVRNVVFGLTALFGVALAFATNPEQRLGGRASQVSETPNLVEFSVQGRAELPADQVGNSVLVFHLPEVPLRLERACSDLLSEEGEYAFQYHFESSRKPTYYQVELLVNGASRRRTPSISLGTTPPPLGYR